MAQRQNVPTPTEVPSTGSEGLASPSAAELSAAIQTLTQAAQALTTIATQMLHVMQSPPGQPASAPPLTQTNTWEDDPFSEAVPTTNPPLATPQAVDTPENTNPLLQTQIRGSRPAPGRYPPGTPNFRYWVAAEALARAINFWTPLLPAGTRWSCPNPLQVTLDAGQDLNAFYSRDDDGLSFFHQAVRNRT